MSLVSLVLYKCRSNEAEPSELMICEDLSFVNMFWRGAMRENIKFQSKVIAGRTRPGCTESIQVLEGIGKGHAWVHPQGIGAVAFVTDKYPMRVAFGLLEKAVQIFLDQQAGQLDDLLVPPGVRLQVETVFKNYQSPCDADPLMRIQASLDEVHCEVHKSMESILRRGECMDSLINKSSELSQSSKKFARMAEQNNGCMQWLRKFCCVDVLLREL